MSEQERDFLDEYADSGDTDTNDTGNESGDIEQVESSTAGTVDTPVTATEGTTASETHEEQHVPLAALKAEREKRQAFEREIAELKRNLAQDKKPTATTEDKPEPTLWEDPESFVNSRVSKAVQAERARFLAMSEDDAREKWPDYDDVFKVVEEAARENPTIAPQILGAANPAKAAYQLGKKLLEQKQMEDPEAYRERLKAEIRAELAAEAEGKTIETERKAARIPPDLSAARNVAKSDPNAVTDPFDTLFKR